MEIPHQDLASEWKDWILRISQQERSKILKSLRNNFGLISLTAGFWGEEETARLIKLHAWFVNAVNQNDILIDGGSKLHTPNFDPEWDEFINNLSSSSNLQRSMRSNLSPDINLV